MVNIKEVLLSDIKPYVNNPRSNDKAIDVVAHSIQEYGFKVPIVLDDKNVIVCGHTRVKAAEKLGLASVPCVIADDLTESQIKAFRLADNRTQEFADWDLDKLSQELAELQEMDVDMSAFDFSFADITKDIQEDSFDVDAALADIVEPTTKSGDLYALGSHRLLCGDCTMIDDMEKLLGGEEAAMVFTDPPYNVNYGEKAGMLNKYQKGHRNTSSIKNDNMASEAFLEFLTDSFKTIFLGLAAGGPIYVCHAESTGLEFRKAFLDTGFLLKQCIIWVKNSMVLGRQDYQWKHEPILYGWKPGAGHKWYGGRKGTTVIEDAAQVVFQKEADHVIINITNGLETMAIRVPEYEVLPAVGHELGTVWRVDKPTVNDVHPTMKPIALCALAIKNSSKAGDLVLDPFGGSGSTLIACEQTGRRGYSLELDPKYVDVIVKRWENLTGKKAELLPKE